MSKNYLLIILFLLTSCLFNSEIKKTSSVQSQCNCTFEFNPVCSNGTTYDNPCLAKCKGVSIFEIGKCECNPNSGPVCATPPMQACPEGMLCTQVMPIPKQYDNECEMNKEGATIIKPGACP